MKKTYRELERIVKGFANHRRLQILNLLNKNSGLSVQGIAEEVHSDIKNISAHINKMHIAGLVSKQSQGNIVRHKLTRRGKSILQFVRIIE